MLICFVLCAAAVLPTAFSDKIEAQNMQQPVPGSSEMIRKLAETISSLGNQQQIRLQNSEEGRPPVLNDDTLPSLYDLYVSLWSKNPYSLRSDFDLDNQFLRSPLLSRSLDQIGDGPLLRRDTVLDSIGGGHLLRREARLDSLGGGHLLKRSRGFSALDPIGGGHLLKRGFQLRQLDSIGGGHLLKRGSEFGQLDSIGGGHLLKRDSLDSIGGGHLLKRYSLDSIGGGHLLKRQFDTTGGRPFQRRNIIDNTKELISGTYVLSNNPTLASKK